MKKLILLAFVAASFSINAQIGATAPDFTVTDINGNTHNLYDILDQGIVAVIDVSATWCGPCWSFHQTHALEELNELHGPDGSNSVRVFFYEGDANTGMDALNGIGNGTYGDWVTGVSYPIINETPISINLGVYAPIGFPTINVVDPTTKTIVADTWNATSAAAQVAAIENATGLTLGSTQSVATAGLVNGLKVYPVPATTTLNIDLSGMGSLVNRAVIMDTFGREITTVPVNTTGVFSADVEELAAGMYILQLRNNGTTLATQQFMK